MRVRRHAEIRSHRRCANGFWRLRCYSRRRFTSAGASRNTTAKIEAVANRVVRAPLRLRFERFALTCNPLGGPKALCQT
jgi:hypothetical protein